MAGLGTGTPVASPVTAPGGIRKRKRKEKKRRWVWTIGQDDDDENAGGSIVALRTEPSNIKTVDEVKTPITAIPIVQVPEITYLETPTPSIESADSASECHDVEMSDSSSCLSEYEERGLTPNEMDLDVKTPTAPHRQCSVVLETNRDTPIPPELLVQDGNSNHPTNRDTPVPPDML